MKGYVTQKGDRWYAVIYEGVDPVTGRERRSWHAAGGDRDDAERLASKLAAERNGATTTCAHSRSALTSPDGGFPANRSRSRPAPTRATAATWNATSSLPSDGSPCGAFGHIHLEAFYATLLRGDGRTGLAPKTVYEIHLVIRGALTDAVRRGLVTRNVALVAHAPRLRAIPQVEQRSWTTEELQAFLRAAAGHRLFAALWTAAFTGMRRNELLGLCWDDLDDTKAALSINRGLVSIGYDSTKRAARPPRPSAHRPGPDDDRRPRRLEGMADHGTARHRHRAVDTDVHRRSRRADQPARHLPDVRTRRSTRVRADPSAA